MGFILVVMALAVPRVLMCIAYLMTEWFLRAFETRLWPILGFVFMPYTTLAYVAVMLNSNHALTGGWLALFIAAIVVDVAHWGGSGHTYRRTPRRA